MPQLSRELLESRAQRIGVEWGLQENITVWIASLDETVNGFWKSGINTGFERVVRWTRKSKKSSAIRSRSNFQRQRAIRKSYQAVRRKNPERFLRKNLNICDLQ